MGDPSASTVCGGVANAGPGEGIRRRWRLVHFHRACFGKGDVVQIEIGTTRRIRFPNRSEHPKLSPPHSCLLGYGAGANSVMVAMHWMRTGVIGSNRFERLLFLAPQLESMKIADPARQSFGFWCSSVAPCGAPAGKMTQDRCAALFHCFCGFTCFITTNCCCSSLRYRNNQLGSVFHVKQQARSTAGSAVSRSEQNCAGNAVFPCIRKAHPMAVGRPVRMCSNESTPFCLHHSSEHPGIKKVATALTSNGHPLWLLVPQRASFARTVRPRIPSQRTASAWHR